MWPFIGISKSRTLWASTVKCSRIFVCRQFFQVLVGESLEKVAEVLIG